MKKLLLGLLFVLSGCSNAEKQPNIIFIMADDLGYGDVGFNGSKWFETPALDELAKHSLVLDKAYMYPTCSPSRAALLTGKHSFRTDVYNVPVLEKGSNQDNIFSRWTVEKQHKVYAEPLRDAGYKSIHIGKWHIVGPQPLKELSQAYPFQKNIGKQHKPGTFHWVAEHKTPAVQAYYPEGRGFDKNVAGTFRGDPALEEGGYNSPRGGYIAPFENPFLENRDDDTWLTDRLTDEAIRFMQANKAEPFFINLHYYAPHRPTIKRSKALFDKYMAKAGDKTLGQGIGAKREEHAAYATMVESLDDNVQRLINFLDQSGLRENTIVIFTSDNGHNGLQSTNGKLRGAKGTIYEGGLRVPTLINWPQKVEPRRTQVAISGLDYFPTFLELANVENYKGILDGNSLVPLFKSDNELASRPLFWHIASTYKNPPNSIIRKGDWKLIQFLKEGNVELYNLKNDSLEASNLAEQHPDIAKALTEELAQWRKQNSVPLPPSSTLEY